MTERRSDRTRAAILTSAKERFAADGYDRATIRAIAADARIDPSMVMRYYGSKERLFAAAAEFDLRLPELPADTPGEIGRKLVTHFVHRWETDESLQMLLRAGTTNPAAAERLREIFAGQVLPVIESLWGQGLPPGEQATRAGLVATQALGMALCRYVLKLPPVVAMDSDEIVDWLSPTIQRYLLGSTP
jgi:AcrR family transcriptional regulator